MRKLLISTLVVAAACGFTERDEAPAAQLRQAGGIPISTGNAPPPELTGSGNSRLGASLGACRVGGYVAGAPGTSELYLVGALNNYVVLGPVGAQSESTGKSVACEYDGVEQKRYAFTAGNAGLYSVKLDGGVHQWLANKSVESIDIAREMGSELAIAAPPEVAALSTQTFTARTQNVAPVNGTVIAWAPGGTYFALGDPDAGVVRVYGGQPTQDAGVVFPLRATVTPPRVTPGSRFGAAIVIGNVHPATGPELIVGAPGAKAVFVFANAIGPGVTPLYELNEDATRPAAVPTEFGASVTVEPLSAETLAAVWVGAPGDNSAHRFIGDAGTHSYLGDPGSRFGAAMVMDGQDLIVGAPEFPSFYAAARAAAAADSAAQRRRQRRVRDG